MNGQLAMTGVSRMDKGTRAGDVKRSDARAFLAQAEADERLAEKMAEADGDMTRIVAIAAEAGYSCTAQELVRAYEEHVRAEPGASAYDFGYPVVYLSLRAPSDLSHAAVYLSLRAPSDLSHAAVYLSLRAPSDAGYPLSS
ncbi:Nif11-like leader peptide family natural product precursor [Sorangium sp. So ce1097]|uniref:Nif11-like leader peptide family natural product precursor n=1 Tax=Sorangium sp. So ce1097 TaxID=3133330 RepID=UPI003F62C9D1